jgi:Transposase DDE domain
VDDGCLPLDCSGCLATGAIQGFVLLKKRWVVERTFVWLMHCRRLTRDYERLPETSEALIYGVDLLSDDPHHGQVVGIKSNPEIF